MSCRLNIVGSSFYTESDNLSLSVRVFSPFEFNVLLDLKYTKMLLVFGCFFGLFLFFLFSSLLLD